MTRSARRAVQFAALTALGAALLAGAARVGVGRFLSSARGKAIVSDKLGGALGMPVEVSEIDVGASSSSFRFRVMDPADPKAEVLNVPSASADVSATDFVTGRIAPSALTFTNPALTLRLGPRGQTLTPLPPLPQTAGAVPAVAVEGGRVCVKTEGRPDFAVSGIRLKVTPADQTVKLSGTVSDPVWGEWTVSGEAARDTRAGWIELRSSDAPLDPALLATIPLVPDGLFDDLPTGRAAVTVRLDFGPDQGVTPTVEVRQTRRVFGLPAESVIRLSPGSIRPRTDLR